MGQEDRTERNRRGGSRGEIKTPTGTRQSEPQWDEGREAKRWRSAQQHGVAERAWEKRRGEIGSLRKPGIGNVPSLGVEQQISNAGTTRKQRFLATSTAECAATGRDRERVKEKGETGSSRSGIGNNATESADMGESAGMGASLAQCRAANQQMRGLPEGSVSCQQAKAVGASPFLGCFPSLLHTFPPAREDKALTLFHHPFLQPIVDG